MTKKHDWVNFNQSKAVRRRKYKRALKAGATPAYAGRLRDVNMARFETMLEVLRGMCA